VVELTNELFRGSSGILTGPTCPSWCTVAHGVNLGEEDWLHLSEPLAIATGVSAQLCMSIDPETQVPDGPYVLIGAVEYTLSEAEALCSSLRDLIAKGSGLGEVEAE
jgi:hypothetical protein